MPHEFKPAATLKIKPAGVKDYIARKAIADWLRSEADRLVTEHNHPLGGREAVYNYDTAAGGVTGGELASFESVE